MLTAFSTALSGLSANEVGVDVVGNNLANLNTPGYKASVASFSDLMAQSMGADGTQIGMGTGNVRTIRQFAQGAVQNSGGLLDAAIQGEGFFVVRDANGQVAYTRAGQFRLDSSGNLLTAGGQRLQGWTAVKGVVDPGGPTADITVPGTGMNQPTATTRMSANLNLDASAADKSTFSTPVQVVDSLGATHVVTITFTKDSSNTWSYKVTIPGEDVTAGTAGTPYDLSVTGALNFDAHGVLTSPDTTTNGGAIAVKITGLKNGAADLNIDWALYNADKTSRLTQFASASATASTDRNGAPAGMLTSVGMTDGGRVVARYSNGESLVVAQLAIAAIRNPDTLIAAGQNLLQVGPDTSTPVVGAADTGGRGKVIGGAIESSTVDIAREFTSLIQYQRGYQANARVIQAADSMSQELVNIVR